MIHRLPNRIEIRNEVRGKMIVRWILGLMAGTMIVWVTSPLFVRSYHGRVYDPISRSLVYPAGTAYRWRSEGYATTLFGPDGMPGRQTPPRPHASRVIALWGDSQAEGVCVADRDKLWRVLQTGLANKAESVDVLPLAKSGTDAADWIRGFDASEKLLGVTEHFLLVCELNDLLPLAQHAPDPMPGMPLVREDALLDVVPDFVIHAARGIFLQSASNELRRLRFGIGPVAKNVAGAAHGYYESSRFPAAEIADGLARSTTLPVTLLYAPRLPVIMGGTIKRTDSQNDAFERLATALRQTSVSVIDCRDALLDAADQGVFPHGFQNGVIGNGHLNETGYRAIVTRIAEPTD